MLRISSFLLILLSFSFSYGAACPEKVDNLSKAMQEFRSDINDADAVMFKGKNGEAVSANEIQQSIKNVESAHQWALMAVQNAKTTWKPKKWSTLPDDKKAAFLDQYEASMIVFAQLLESYQKAFESLPQPPSAKDFESLSDISMKIHSFANEAHRKF